MTRKMAISLVVAAALTLPAAAATPLPPGRPAGSKIAQISENQVMFIGAGALTLGLGLYLASGQYKIAGDDGATPPVTPPVITPSTTP